MKICSKCKQQKPLSEFNAKRDRTSGVNSQCKACQKEWDRNQNAMRRDTREPRQDGTKCCNACKTEKPITDFYIYPKSKDGRRADCKACQAKYYRRHKLAQLGWTQDEYEKLLEAQGGRCAICKRPENMRISQIHQPLSVDHDHKTNKVRGLLCHNCNVALGLLDDSPEILSAAIEYLS